MPNAGETRSDAAALASSQALDAVSSYALLRFIDSIRRGRASQALADVSRLGVAGISQPVAVVALDAGRLFFTARRSVLVSRRSL